MKKNNNNKTEAVSKTALKKLQMLIHNYELKQELLKHLKKKK